MLWAKTPFNFAYKLVNHKNYRRYHLILIIFSALSSVSELVRRIARVIVDEQQTQLLRVLLTTAVVIRSVINSSDEPDYRKNKAKDLRVTLSETLSEVLLNSPNQSEISVFLIFPGEEPLFQ